MTKIVRSLLLLPLSFVCITSFSCASPRGPRSAYQAFYQNRLEGIRVPTYEEIVSLGESPVWETDQPLEKVWDACLRFAVQSRGVLGVEEDLEGGKRLVLLSGETLDYSRDRRAFVDRWLAVSARRGTDHSKTEVRVALVSPQNTQVAPFSADTLMKGFKGDKGRSVGSRAGQRFLLALSKTFEEDTYLDRLGSDLVVVPRGAVPRPGVQSTGHRESVAEQLGNFESASIRRESLVLEVPRLEGRIAEIIHDLALAAGRPHQEVEVYILAEPVSSVYIEPNGDLFITTGALDEITGALDDDAVGAVDELAGILSHELAHIYLDHWSERSWSYKRAGASRNTVMTAIMLGGAVLGGLVPTSTKPTSESPQDAIVTNEELIVGTAVGLGAWYLASQLGVGLGTGIGGVMIQSYTRKQELEADGYGAELLWSAGYDHRGLLTLLQKKGASKLFEASDKR